MASQLQPITPAIAPVSSHPTLEQGARREVVASFVSGLQVLRSFSTQRPIMTLSAVAEEAGLTRAAARVSPASSATAERVMIGRWVENERNTCRPETKLATTSRRAPCSRVGWLETGAIAGVMG